MIDASIDPDLAALERQESLKVAWSPAGGRENADGAQAKIHHGRLARLSVRATDTTAGEAGVGVPPPVESEGPDPLGHLQAARLGIFAVVVLVIYWLWLRKRRQAR